MEHTVVRQHDTAVMVVGPSGPNAERVTAALEQARVKVVRVGSAPVACEKLASAMPQVVILVAPQIAPLLADLAERAEAVGAVVIDVDEALDGEAYEDTVNEIITTAITRKMERDDVEGATISVDVSEPPPRSNGASMTTATVPPATVPQATDLSTILGNADPAVADESAVVDDGWDD